MLIVDIFVVVPVALTQIFLLILFQKSNVFNIEYGIMNIKYIYATYLRKLKSVYIF